MTDFEVGLPFAGLSFLFLFFLANTKLRTSKHASKSAAACIPSYVTFLMLALQDRKSNYFSLFSGGAIAKTSQILVPDSPNQFRCLRA
jgi:hypothetical protein